MRTPGETGKSLFLTIKDVADLLQVTTRTVWNWIERGDLEVHRFVGATRIWHEDFEDFVSRSRLRGRQPTKRNGNSNST